jgi:hypothetical protein
MQDEAYLLPKTKSRKPEIKLSSVNQRFPSHGIGSKHWPPKGKKGLFSNMAPEHQTTNKPTQQAPPKPFSDLESAAMQKQQKMQRRQRTDKKGEMRHLV